MFVASAGLLTLRVEALVCTSTDKKEQVVLSYIARCMLLERRKATNGRSVFMLTLYSRNKRGGRGALCCGKSVSLSGMYVKVFSHCAQPLSRRCC